MQRWAVTGLLFICLALAAGLGLTAYLNYRAAHHAAQDVLYSRASELAASFLSTARWSGALGDEQRLDQLAGEMALEGTSIAVIDHDGVVRAAGGGSSDAVRVGQRVPPPPDLLPHLRSQGQYQRMVASSHFEHWRAMAPGSGPGWGRHLRRLLGFGGGNPGRDRPPPAGLDGKREPAGHGPASRPGPTDDSLGPPRPPGLGPGPGPRFRLLRVTVPVQAAHALIAPARLTVSVAGVVSLALLALGLLLHRAARRAQTVAAELQRRRALSALGEMAAVLAHEIRTPLASMKGNAQLIGEGQPEDERARSIVDEAGRLERLVNGLLDYARPRDPRRVPCNPDDLVARAAQIVAPMAAAASVDLVTDPCACGPCLRADPDQLLQVLVNLLQNAVEATASGETRHHRTPVVVGAHRGGGWVNFTVLDAGPGLPAGSPAEQLFRPFFSTKKEGTGLGLAVARQVVEQHGGELELQPRKEGGVLASVRLPEGDR